MEATKKMATKPISTTEETNELLRKLLIIQLGLAGVSQQNIRAVVGGNLKRVTDIMKLVKSKDRT